MRREVSATKSTAINGDCMDVMREYPDKYFDLAAQQSLFNGNTGED
nr:MAG TPA: adenine-specific methyltransferase [Caudoviricetes sp.]